MTDTPRTVTGYMCRTDFECELGCACDGNKVYPSIKALKAHLRCWRVCGIVEVQVTLSKIVEQGTDPS